MAIARAATAMVIAPPRRVIAPLSADADADAAEPDAELVILPAFAEPPLVGLALPEALAEPDAEDEEAEAPAGAAAARFATLPHAAAEFVEASPCL
jgi:hypothetical protein